MIDLSPQQRDAVNAVVKWYRDPNGGLVHRLFGFAGSGKTTLAKHIAELLAPEGGTQYAAYSGKAANVLQRKGCVGASTIHRLIYKPVSKSRAELRELQDKIDFETDPETVARLAQQIADLERELASPSFMLNPDGPLRGAPLLILDEVSMVTEQMAADLESFGVPILCLGDPMQLPPIKGEGHYTAVRPDTMLTEIHRSALDSPVTRLATTARTSDDDDYGIDGMDGDSGRSAVPVPLTDFDQILVWKNATRWQVIQKVRKLSGNLGRDPQPGEKILTLANNAEAEVLNGEQFTILSVASFGSVLDMTVRTESGYERDLKVWRSGFEDQDGEEQAKRRGWSGPIAAATYAHALTVHKAQGSQWDRVLVLDESAGVARTSGADTAQRWFYTALTRAAKQVVIRPAPRR